MESSITFSPRMQSHLARWKSPSHSMMLLKESTPEIFAEQVILPRLINMIDDLVGI